MKNAMKTAMIVIGMVLLAGCEKEIQEARGPSLDAPPAALAAAE